MKLLFYVFKELKNNRRFCALFLLNLTMGLAGFVALDGYKVSIDHTIRGRSKAVLGADFGLSARRPITEAEQSLVEGTLRENYRFSRMVEMFSMVANKNKRSRLVQIKAIDDKYPFYGEILLREKGAVGADQHRILKEQRKVWIYPELTRQLDVKVGEMLGIGEQEFQVEAIVAEDAAAGISTNMAPRIYMNQVHLPETGLLREGSIAWHSIIYKLPGRSPADLNQYRDTIFKIMDSPELQVYTHENVSQQMATLVSRLNDFLGLSSLVALFLAAVSSAFLFRSYFRQRIQQVATLLCLGASRWQAFGYYLIQILILGTISAVLACILGFVLVPGLGELTRELLPFQVQFILDPRTLLLSLVVGTVGSLLICLPILVGLRDLRPSLLLVAEKSSGSRISGLAVLASLPILLLFFGLAVWLANSYQVGGLFTLLFLISTFVLGGGALGLFSVLSRLRNFQQVSLRWALRDLARNRLSTMTCFVAIGLGSVLLNIVPQLQKTLQAELERPEQSKLPSLFMFDIQEEQLPDFEKVLAGAQVKVDQISPMIRGRLVRVNDEEFDKGEGIGKNLTREQEREMRFRNRGFNLTYRKELSEAEAIVAGRDFERPYREGDEALPEISMEQRFAARLGIKIGDVLEFDVESIPIVGKVVNLRSVKWTSFRPNFFVQFQPGVLEMAPKTFVATIPNLPLEQKQQLQDQLVQALPNVSMVDVSRIVSRISGIMEQMSWALAFMSLLCLLAGLVVVYSIANHQATSRGWQIGLLKALGAPFATIQGQFLWQFGLLSFFALSLGALLSLVVSYVLSAFLFESLWVFDWKTPLLTVGIGSLIALIVTWLAIRRSLQRKTSLLFSEFS